MWLTALTLVVVYLVWCCREQKLTRPPGLARDGVVVFPPGESFQETALALLPEGYQFLDYRYTIKGCSLSTFHRDVTSSGYEFGTTHPVYTLIVYHSGGKTLAVVPGSHRTVPFVWNAPKVVSGTAETAVLFDCDTLHAGVMSRDPQRHAVQYKIAHTADLPLLEALQGIDKTVEYGSAPTDGSGKVSLAYEWLSRKVSLLFPFFFNHVLTRHLQSADGSLINRLMLLVFGRTFYNR